MPGLVVDGAQFSLQTLRELQAKAQAARSGISTGYPYETTPIVKKGGNAKMDYQATAPTVFEQRQFVVVASSVVLQASAAMDSAKKGKLKKGLRVKSTKTQELPDGSVRVYCEKGWLSITAADGTVLLEEEEEEKEEEEQTESGSSSDDASEVVE